MAYVCAILSLVVLVVALWLARTYLFGWMKGSAGEQAPAQGFTLSDLRQLHKSGAMTDEEFERAKAKIVQTVQAAAAQPPVKPENTGGGGAPRGPARGGPPTEPPTPKY
jgi:hypothetical protein